MSQLLVENEKFDYVEINERSSKYGPKLPGVLVRVEGPSGITEQENRNKRFYTNRLWERVLSDKALMEKMKGRGLFGEADHPNSFGTSVMRASHLVTNLWLEKQNNALQGFYEVLDTLPGRVVHTMFRAKAALGVSTRGAGNIVSSTGRQIVDENDYRFSTVDFVIDPSAQNAYPTAVQEQLDELFRTPRDGAPFDPTLQPRVERLIAEISAMKERELLMKEDVRFYKELAEKRLAENRTFVSMSSPRTPQERAEPLVESHRDPSPPRPRESPLKLSLRPVFEESDGPRLSLRELLEENEQALSLRPILEESRETLSLRPVLEEDGDPDETDRVDEAERLRRQLAAANRQLDEGHEAFVALRRRVEEQERTIEEHVRELAHRRTRSSTASLEEQAGEAHREARLWRERAEQWAAEASHEVPEDIQEHLEKIEADLEEALEEIEEKDMTISDLREKLTKASRGAKKLYERNQALTLVLTARQVGISPAELRESCRQDGIRELKEVEGRARELALSRLQTGLPNFELDSIRSFSLSEQLTEAEQAETEEVGKISALVGSVGGYS